MPAAILTRRYYISAMHSLGNPSLSETENREIFGPCYRMHGHDYKIDVSVRGDIDPVWGRVIDRDHMDQVVEKVLVRPHHKMNLNNIFPNTSGEALVQEFFRLLKKELPALTCITVVETHRNTFVAKE